MNRPGRARPRRHQEAGPHPKGGGWRAHGRGRTPEHERTWSATPTSTPPSTVTPARLLRGAGQRAGGDRSGILAPSRGLLRRTWHHRRTVLSDNGSCYRSRCSPPLWLGPPQLHQALPTQTNGKAERFNRTLLAEWAYARPGRQKANATARLAHWLHIYNHHRHHTAIGGPPCAVSATSQGTTARQPGGSAWVRRRRALRLLSMPRGPIPDLAVRRPGAVAGVSGCPRRPRRSRALRLLERGLLAWGSPKPAVGHHYLVW